jgi:hypothetical protein
MTADFRGSIEVVRGGLGDDRADQVLEFWAGQAGLAGPEAAARLPQVVCVALSDDGAVVGVNSVFQESVALVGGRRFWVYRALLAEPAGGAWDLMLAEAFAALEGEFDPEGDDPIGLVLREEGEGPAEAVTPATLMSFAGWDGSRRLRVRYFDDARIAPGTPHSPPLDVTRELDQVPLDDRYSLEPFGESEVSESDVKSLWQREAAIPEEEAARRVGEVHLVAVERDEGVVGVSSAYLKRSDQLGAQLWHYRAFVAQPHRKSALALQLAVNGRRLLEERFVSGEDTRAPGIVYEVENEGLKQYFNRALWLPTDFTFIGENARGDHVRVHWFPGATVPSL